MGETIESQVPPRLAAPLSGRTPERLCDRRHRKLAGVNRTGRRELTAIEMKRLDTGQSHIQLRI